MKKIFVSVGLAAAGAAGFTSAMAQSMEAGPTPKMWNVNGSLRGFYDDNYAVANNKKGSFGIELTPSASANIDLQQTTIGIRYTFGMYWYQQRADNGMNAVDYTHQADLWLEHAFTGRVKLNLTDTFAVAQDPKLVDGGAVTRVEGNNLANHAKATLTTDWTRQFSTATFYGNDLYIYSDSGTTNAAAGTDPSTAALLNRIEQKVGTDFQWHFQPETVGFIGYAYSWVRYTGDKQISPQQVIGSKLITYMSDARNYNAHYGYVGVSHEFSPNLSGTGRVGASYTDLYNDPVSASKSWAPYADLSVVYTYIPGSYMQAGYRQDMNSTDIVAPNNAGHLTQYQESSVFYFDINHRFTPKITGSLVSQYMYSSYKEGAYSGNGDSAVSAGVNLTYQINRHFSCEAGYNFDELFSSISGRDNTRNRVYIGLGAQY